VPPRHCCLNPGRSDIEDFVAWIVEKEPDKTQLHFCLGVINFLCKGDPARAVLDFQKFLEVTPADQFAEEQRLAMAYIDTINGISNSSQSDIE
jgi:hypothetical protein